MGQFWGKPYRVNRCYIGPKMRKITKIIIHAADTPADMDIGAA